ncbi:hypothetical protein ABZY44_23475 [Streptomyces sp. NPDC006544]|uniref:hypothetical protein n=1 Tax=Streptomyces sp. NPDC006544 TaxID=3154583 RepID=UPI0033AAFD0A
MTDSFASRRRRATVSVSVDIQPAEAEALLRVWGDGGIETNDAAQRKALEDLVASEVVSRGGIVDRFHDNVLYSFRMLLEPPAPTDTCRAQSRCQ